MTFGIFIVTLKLLWIIECIKIEISVFCFFSVGLNAVATLLTFRPHCVAWSLFSLCFPRATLSTIKEGIIAIYYPTIFVRSSYSKQFVSKVDARNWIWQKVVAFFISHCSHKSFISMLLLHFLSPFTGNFLFNSETYWSTFVPTIFHGNEEDTWEIVILGNQNCQRQQLFVMKCQRMSPFVVRNEKFRKQWTIWRGMGRSMFSGNKLRVLINVETSSKY